MSYYNDLHEGNIPGTEEGSEVKDDGSGVQPWSKGELYPWVHTYVENKDMGTGRHFYKHPDGRETRHRLFNLNSRAVYETESWSTIQHRVAEQDAREAIERDKRAAEAGTEEPKVVAKRPAVRTSGTLQNGAEIITQIGEVALAKYHDEYATWFVDNRGFAGCGHYFPGDGSRPADSGDLVDAMNDFIRRVKAT